MLKKYLTKFTVDILPSVAATVIGAYIVNHYIVSKPGPGAPVASAVSTVNPKAAPEAAKIDVKADAKTAGKTADKTPDTAAEIGNSRGPGVKAKGISERAILEKAAAERPQEKQEKSGENVADKPAETASIPAETRRHQPAPREKTAAKTVPAPAPVVSAPAQPAPAQVAPVQAAPAEAASAQEERRDANDLARAAIDRLRGSNDGSPRSQEAARVPDAARVPEAPRVVLAPAVRPLPPPVMVSTPERETVDATPGYQEMKPPYAAGARNDGPHRPTPPAEIPSPPLDLRAEASEPVGRAEGSGPLARARTTAEDVLSAAKSVFHVVLPK
jgi:hypothetical protein